MEQVFIKSLSLFKCKNETGRNTEPNINARKFETKYVQ